MQYLTVGFQKPQISFPFIELLILNLFRGFCIGTFFIFCVPFFVLTQEFAVRFALPQFDPSQHLKFVLGNGNTPILGKPNSTQRLLKNSGDYDVSVTFNKHGLRDKDDISEAKESCTMVVGNSFAFGWGVEESERFSDQLSSNMNIEIYNLATTGGLENMTRQLNYAKKLGAKCHRVIFSINVKPELQKKPVTLSKNNTRPHVTATMKRVSSFHQHVSSIKGFLSANSAIYFLMTHTVHKNNWLRNKAISIGLIRELGSSPDEQSMSLEAIEPLVEKIKRITHGFDAIVLLIPPRATLTPRKTEKQKNLYDTLVDNLNKAGVRIIDPLPVFEKDTNPKRRYHFVHDGHWTVDAHRVAADLLSKSLKRWTP